VFCAGIEFYTAIYDLRDAGLAIVHLDGAVANEIELSWSGTRTRHSS
jgi:hypothetical protein